MKKKYIITISILLSLGIIVFILLLTQETKKRNFCLIPYTPEEKFGLFLYQWNVHTDTVKQEDLLGTILLEHGISGQQIDKISKQSTDSLKATFIHVGRPYHIFYDTIINNVPQMKYFVYENNLTKYTRYDFTNPDTIIINKQNKQIDTLELTAYGVIKSSLWQALIDKGYSWNLAIALSQTFAWTVDFYSLQEGDWFKIVFDDLIVDGKSIEMPEIKAGLFFHGNRELWSIPFKVNDSSKISFFDTIGNSMRKTFLKAPLKYTRISSRYSNARMHPIFHRPTEHKATDYAAPCGTPIFAASDGTITSRGWRGGAGNMITIRHNSIYTTVYMHMSQFGKYQVGDYVLQGETIGYVGSTGWSTGCHLHYEIHENGCKIDPLKFDPPAAEPIDSANMPRFNKEKQIWINKIKNIKEK